jgi:sterol-4alpha-carboxylate 3-dehydrogenase (decarboxylating)
LIQQFFELSPRPQLHVFDLRPLPETLPKCFTFTKDDITFHQGDITSSKDVLSAIEQSHCDVIVHSASPVHGQKQEIYEKVNVQGTQNVINVAKKASVKALVYTSSAGVIFNGQNISNADENWPIPEVPMDGYNKTKAEAEEMVLRANSFEDGFLTVALRPAGIFGPGDRQLVPGLRQVAAMGQSKFQIGDNNNLFDWTYAGNVADAHVLAAQQILDTEKQKQIGGEVFFITNDSPSYFWTLARAVWKQDGHIEKYNIVLQRPVAIVAGYLSVFFSKLLKKEPGLTPFRVKVVCAIRYHNITKAKTILGYKPNVDIEEGIKRTLEWMDEEKK